MRIMFHSERSLNSVKKQGQQGELTHRAHNWGQVFPAQLEDGQRVVARHVPDVGTEAIRSCR